MLTRRYSLLSEIKCVYKACMCACVHVLLLPQTMSSFCRPFESMSTQYAKAIEKYIMGASPAEKCETRSSRSNLWMIGLGPHCYAREYVVY